MAGRHSRAPRPPDALVTQVAAWTSVGGPGASASSALWLCGSLRLPSSEGFWAHAGHREHMQCQS